MSGDKLLRRVTQGSGTGLLCVGEAQQPEGQRLWLSEKWGRGAFRHQMLWDLNHRGPGSQAGQLYFSQ